MQLAQIQYLLLKVLGNNSIKAFGTLVSKHQQVLVIAPQEFELWQKGHNCSFTIFSTTDELQYSTVIC